MVKRLVPLFVLATATFAKTNDLFDKSLEEILKIDIVSLKEETLIEAPAVLSILTQKDFKNFGARSLKDILSFIPGIYSLTSSDFRDSGSASIRGQHSSSIDKHILILINNRPIRESYSSGLNNDLFNGFPVEVIERVEVVRGPSSVLYGSNAFEGVINIKLKKNISENILSVAKGQFGQNLIEVLTAKNFNDGNLNISARFDNRTDWKDDIYDDSLSYGTYDQDTQNKSFLLDTDYKNTKLTVMLTESKDVTLGGDNSFKSYLIDHRRKFVNLGHKIDLNETSSIEFNSTLNTIDTNHEQERHSKAEDILGEFVYKNQLTDKFFFILGGSISYVSGSNKSDNAETRKFHDVANNYYTQFDIEFSRSLKLQAGAQYHKTEQQPNDLSPRVGLVYRMNENFALKALYGQAYRAPSGFERSISLRIGTGGLDGNPNLKSEKIETSSLSLNYQNMDTIGAVTIYTSKQKNSIRVFFDPTLTNDDDFKNSGKSSYNGIELEFQKKYTLFDFYFNSSYQENKNFSNVKDTQKVPNYMIKFGGNYKFNKEVSIGLYDQYFSKIKSESTNKLNPESKAYHDFRLNIDYNKEMKNSFFTNFYILFQINNLFEKDSVYQPDISTSKINTIPHKMGRNFILKATVKF
ncbi:TonB-dependent siderophore receptor [Bacteriovorax sp. Seq25_V]|uniref:TonB-dependent receptor plug domain-containing protein n=1 Tax=Bacteriovorax sp. Seq25_V TaxID=1201288 RepID=UPI00038A09CF|nr:TonB-dependent receptor [Bacteriovorax sp. Seq25_V]EQC47426.1 TonB-dependent receptor plug domain protein [Bacteriovorax sp. Seq25_V]